MRSGGHFLLKLDRASCHLKDLEAQLTKWSEDSKHRIFKEADPERGPNRFRVRISPEVIPIHPYAVIIGDVVHNLRSTLDILAFELLAAMHHPNPPPHDLAETSQFPIFGDNSKKGVHGSGPTLWSSGSPRMIGGIHPEAQAIIQSLQPYQRGNDYVTHPLWMLRDLSNIDKHRLLLTGALKHAGAAIMPDKVKNAILEDPIEVYGDFVEGETIIVRYGARSIDPSKEMNVDFDAWLKIVFKCGSVVDRKSVLETLAEIRNFIASDVIKPLQKYTIPALAKSP